MLAVYSGHKMYFLYVAFHLVEIYDPAKQIITRHFETKWGGSHWISTENFNGGEVCLGMDWKCPGTAMQVCVKKINIK